MASTNKTAVSPFASAFRSAISRGTPSTTAVQSIARRRGTTPTAVFQSLHRSGVVQRQRFNGKWVYWPVTATKGKKSNISTIQTNLFQQIIDWAIASGSITPKQLQNAKGSQQQFVKVGRKFFTSPSRKTRHSASSSQTRKSSSTARSSSRSSSAKRTQQTINAGSASSSTRTATKQTQRPTPARSTARTRTAHARSTSRRATTPTRSTRRTVRIGGTQRRLRRAA